MSDLSHLEHRFACAVGALDDAERPDGLPPGGVSSTRSRLVAEWARSTSDEERLALAQEAEMHLLEAVAGPLRPRNAGEKRKPSEQWLVWWRLVLMYGRRSDYVGPNGERVPWTPEKDARALTKHYAAEAKKWLDSDKIIYAKQPRFIETHRDAMRAIVDDDGSYEPPPAPSRLPPDGPLLHITERMLKGDAARRLFHAAMALQIHFDALAGAPSWIAVWSDILGNTVADTMTGVAALPGRALQAAGNVTAGVLKPLLIGGAVVGGILLLILLWPRGSGSSRVEVVRA